MQSDHELRIRLEGGAELLEATRLRYRALVGALAAFGWKEKVRRNLELLAATAKDQPRVDQVLTLLARKVETEGWAQGPVLACADEVRALRERLGELVARRREDERALSLAQGLAALEQEVLEAPRFVLPGERWSLATQLLPTSLPEVQAAGRFGALCEQLFTSPLTLEALPTSEVLAAFEVARREALEVLPSLWKRLEGVDRTGGVVRALRRRAARLPRFTEAEAQEGPAHLIRAQFWQSLAQVRMEQFLVDRLEPVVPRTEEVFRVFSWIVECVRTPDAPFEHAALAEPRRALLELAARLRGNPGAGRVTRPIPRLKALAELADQNPGDEDWRRLRDSLSLVTRAATSHFNKLPPIYRSLHPPRPTPTSQTLAALVAELEASFSR